MAYSSLTGIDRAPATTPGTDSDMLGPSDTSDSGSDVAGIASPDDGGPDAPLDRAMAPDIERPDTSVETVGRGIDSDSHGTGERRSAGGDAGLHEAADISPDRIVDDPDAGITGDSDGDADADAATPAQLAALVAEAEFGAEADDEEDDDEGEDESEDESADPVGDPSSPPVEPVRRGDVDDEGDDLVRLKRG